MICLLHRDWPFGPDCLGMRQKQMLHLGKRDNFYWIMILIDLAFDISRFLASDISSCHQGHPLSILQCFNQNTQVFTRSQQPMLHLGHDP